MLSRLHPIVEWRGGGCQRFAGGSGDRVGRPLRPAQELAGLFAADEIFLGGVPSQLAAKQHGQVAEVARAQLAVMAEDVGDRLRAILDALEDPCHKRPVGLVEKCEGGHNM
jgi:hypothetical protein